MLRRALSLCAVLGLASVAQAGVVVTLNSSNSSPLPGDTFTIEVLGRLDAPTPSGATSIRLRLAQFDLSDTSAALLPGMRGATTAPDAESGPVRFWNFSSTTTCQGDSTLCGDRYLIDGELPSPPLPVNIFNIAFTGTTQSLPRMLALSTTSLTSLGVMDVVLPSDLAPGNYLIDVLNANEADENLGADIRYGFGTATDPAGSFRASNGGIVYSAVNPGGGFAFTVIPEPATLAMLGLGGLAAAFRRRRSA